MIKSGADVKAKSSDGKTVLDYAKENKNIYNTDVYWELNDAFYNQRPETVGAIDYVARRNDTMYRIILNHYGTYSEDILQAITDANNLSAPHYFGIGDKLILPFVVGVGAPKRR